MCIVKISNNDKKLIKSKKDFYFILLFFFLDVYFHSHLSSLTIADLLSRGIHLFFFNFYWSIVDLQCCVSFSYTAKWISYTYTYIYIYIYILSRVPVLYSRSLLVIHFIYSSVYMSIPMSQFNPPPCYPLVTVSLFSTSVTLFLFCR